MSGEHERAGSESGPVVARRRHTFADLYHERTNFNFTGRAWRWAVLTGVIMVIAVVGLAVRGLNLGIDFEGGTQWQVTMAQGIADIDDVRDVLADAGLPDARVLIIGDSTVRVQDEQVGGAEQAEIRDALADYAGVPRTDVSVTEVGPTWGNQVTSKALVALGAFFALIALYLTFRFELRMAIAALAAVVHDIFVTVGVYAITGFEVVPATVIAFLTILGFSLYDTVVVFDKITENTPSVGVERGDTYSVVANRSLNQVLMRSLNTSFVALLPVLSLLIVGAVILGATALKDFALALFVGLLTGAYSSIFVATPLLAWLKEREPRYAEIRARAQSQAARSDVVTGRRGGRGGELAAAGSTPGRPSPRPGAPSSPPPSPAPGARGTSPAGGPAGSPIAPRPRRQRRRKRR